MAWAGSWTGGSITMEWAREVEMGNSGRSFGVQGPVVRMTVSADKVTKGFSSDA
jgi:hypothetical protein